MSRVAFNFPVKRQITKKSDGYGMEDWADAKARMVRDMANILPSAQLVSGSFRRINSETLRWVKISFDEAEWDCYAEELEVENE